MIVSKLHPFLNMVQWKFLLLNGHHRDFALYSEVSFAQELVGDHATLIILVH